jgi:hypothetical protein
MQMVGRSLASPPKAFWLDFLWPCTGSSSLLHLGESFASPWGIESNFREWPPNQLCSEQLAPLKPTLAAHGALEQGPQLFLSRIGVGT